MTRPHSNNLQTLHQELTWLCERHGVSSAVLLLEYLDGEIALSIRGTPLWASATMDIHARAIRDQLVRSVTESLADDGLFGPPK